VASVNPACPPPAGVGVHWSGVKGKGGNRPAMGFCPAGVPLPPEARLWCREHDPAWTVVPVVDDGYDDEPPSHSGGGEGGVRPTPAEWDLFGEG
jgi:hypothetical protein